MPSIIRNPQKANPAALLYFSLLWCRLDWVELVAHNPLLRGGERENETEEESQLPAQQLLRLREGNKEREREKLRRNSRVLELRNQVAKMPSERAAFEYPSERDIAAPPEYMASPGGIFPEKKERGIFMLAREHDASVAIVVVLPTVTANGQGSFSSDEMDGKCDRFVEIAGGKRFSHFQMFLAKERCTETLSVWKK